jgi:hypothetical protein
MKKDSLTRIGKVVGLSCLLLSASSPAGAVPIDVIVDTTLLSGTPATLAFDLLDGDPASNTATISDFSTDGALGTSSTSGGPVSGALPGTVTIADGSFFNEYLQDITLGSMLSFRVDLTSFSTGSPIPDSFSFFILDASLLPLFPTSDPTGADALFVVDIDGSPTGAIASFEATDSPPSATWLVAPATPVPAPTTLSLLAIGLGWIASRSRYTNR